MGRFGFAASLFFVALGVGSAAKAQEAHMDTRVDLLFRLGFAGKVTFDPGAFSVSADADTSFGADLRVDVPVGRYFTLGPVISAYAVRPDLPGFDRNPFVDLGMFFKPRFPFGRKKKLEVYAALQAGFTMGFLRRTDPEPPDRFGIGYQVGIAPGFQMLITRGFGILSELGWMRTQGNFDGGNVIVNQAVWRVGFVF